MNIDWHEELLRFSIWLCLIVGYYHFLILCLQAFFGMFAGFNTAYGSLVCIISGCAILKLVSKVEDLMEARQKKD